MNLHKDLSIITWTVLGMLPPPMPLHLRMLQLGKGEVEPRQWTSVEAKPRE